MLITVELPDDIAAAAQARGTTPESFVRALVDEAVRSTPNDPTPATRKKDIHWFLKEMAADSDNIPQLPDEAFTRESFYRDHD